MHSLGDDVTWSEHAIVFGAESPGGAAVLGFVRIRAVDAARVIAIKVPEPVLVGGEQDALRREPLGLHDRLGGAARDDGLVGERSVVGKRRNVQLRAVPRHVRVVPAEEADAAAVGGEARRRIEVVAAMQIDRGAGCDVYCQKTIFSFFRSGTLTHRDEARAGFVDDEIRVTRFGIGVCDRNRNAAGKRNAIDVLIGEIDEIGVAVRREVRAATVLVHASANVERSGREFGPLAVAPHDQRVAAAFFRTRFEPEQRIDVAGQRTETGDAGGNEFGADRRRPTAVRGGAGHWTTVCARRRAVYRGDGRLPNAGGRAMRRRCRGTSVRTPR